MIFLRELGENSNFIEGKNDIVNLKCNMSKSKSIGRSRQEQANAIKKIVKKRFGSTNTGRYPFVIIGDFDDYLKTDFHGSTGIRALVKWNQIENVNDWLPDDEQWTHYFKGNSSCGIGEKYSRLD